MKFNAASEYCGRSDLLDKYGKGSEYVPPRPLYIPIEKKHNSFWRPHEFPGPSDAWINKAGIFVEKCHEALLKKPETIKWLSQRGIPLDVLKKSMLGWNNGDAGQDIYRSRIQWGLPLEKNQAGKLKPLWLPVDLVIPYFKKNKVVRLRIRRNKGARKGFDIKYYVLPGSYMGPMVIHPERSCFVITESELDALACAAAASDIVGVIGLGNASTRPDPQTTNFLKTALQILFALDADAQGGKDMKWWHFNFENSDPWPVPIGKDPGEAFSRGLNLEEWIKAGVALCPALIVKMENQGRSTKPDMLKKGTSIE